MGDYIDIFGIVEKVEGNTKYEVYEIKDFCIATLFTDNKLVEVLTGEYGYDIIPLIDNLEEDRKLAAFKMDYIFDNIENDYTINDLIVALKEELVGCKLYCEYENSNLINVIISKDVEDKKDSIKEDFSVDLKEISKNIKSAIINQDEVVDKALTNIIYNQKLYYSNLPIHEARLLKKNMLIYGKTGTGKTEIIKQIISNLDSDIPLVIEDANGYTVAGYKGGDVTDMLRRLYQEADYDTERASHGVLVIDEIDKKLKNGDEYGISSTGVQKALLKVIEGGEFDLTTDSSPEYNGVVLDTSLISVILLGHFEKLYKNETVKKNTIGFNASRDEEISISKKEYDTKDFVKIGMIPEFIGRINSIVKTNDIDIDTIKKIIKESSISPIALETKFYEELGVKISFDDDFIDKLARLAYEKKTGARAIKSSYDELIGDINYDVLSGNVDEIRFEKGKVRKLGTKKVNNSNKVKVN